MLRFLSPEFLFHLKSRKSNARLNLLAGVERNRNRIPTAKCKAKAAAKQKQTTRYAPAKKPAMKGKETKKPQAKKMPRAPKAKARPKAKQLKQDYGNVYSRCYHAKRKAGSSKEEASVGFQFLNLSESLVFNFWIVGLKRFVQGCCSCSACSSRSLQLRVWRSQDGQLALAQWWEKKSCGPLAHNATSIKITSIGS